MKKLSQLNLIKEFFRANPNRDIEHSESVDWLTSEWKQRTGETFRDPDRGIRSLSQSGFLIKISKGVYRYDPTLETQRHLEDFTEQQKAYIKKRDDYKCVFCGATTKEGIELHVDHIKPKQLGGKATIENGQTLCATHNFRKNTLKQTETGKKMFMRLYELAKVEQDVQTLKFCEDILQTFEEHGINGHIKWRQ